jgi:hypothetical protein
MILADRLIEVFMSAPSFKKIGFNKRSWSLAPKKRRLILVWD